MKYTGLQPHLEETKSAHRSGELLLTELTQAQKNEPESVFGEKSVLWLDLLESRTKRATLDELSTMLSISSKIRHGTAADGGETSRKELGLRFGKYVETESTEMFAVPAIGQPDFIGVNGVPISTSHIFKFGTCRAISDALQTQGLPLENLRCAEIGGGWGAVASMLLSRKVISSYLGIDLLENLTNCAYYLTQSFHDMEYTVVGISKRENPQLSFCLPGYVDTIHSRFDLIINEASIAEMPHETANAYLTWVQDHLDTDGLFFWQNGRSRSQRVGLTSRMSDYRLSRFKPVMLQPQRGRASLENDAAILLVGQNWPTGESPNLALDDIYDILVQLADIGLTDELLDLYSSVCSGLITDDQATFLDASQVLFSKLDTTALEAFLSDPARNESLRVSANYLCGMTYASKNNLGNAEDKIGEYFSAGISPLGLAFTAAAHIAFGWKTGQIDPIQLLEKRLTREHHWPAVIARSKWTSTSFQNLLRRKLVFPWLQTQNAQPSPGSLYRLFNRVRRGMLRFTASSIG